MCREPPILLKQNKKYLMYMENNESLKKSFVELASSFSKLAQLIVARVGEAEVEAVCPKEVASPVETPVLFEDISEDIEIGNVFSDDLELDNNTKEALRYAISDLAANTDDFILPVDPVSLHLHLTALDSAKLPRWKYKHIHISNDGASNAMCIDAAHNCGGIPAAAAALAAIARGEDILPGTCELAHTDIEQKLIRDGIMNEADYLITEDELYKVFNTDYTIKLVPGISSIFRAFECNEEGDISAISIVRVINFVAASLLKVNSTPHAFHTFLTVVNIAASVKECQLAELIITKFKDEIAAGKTFVTLPQAEVITGKTASEIALMLIDKDINMRIVECQRGGNLFVIDKATLDVK